MSCGRTDKKQLNFKKIVNIYQLANNKKFNYSYLTSGFKKIRPAYIIYCRMVLTYIFEIGEYFYHLLIFCTILDVYVVL